MQANSRDDVTVTPESLSFGHIKRASQPTGSVNVIFLGSGQWSITGVQCDSNYVKAKAAKSSRNRNEVVYKVTAQLRSDAPVGRWFTDIWLTTNNPATPRVRVPLTVEIESALTVSPAVVDLGQPKIGSQVERRVIVRGVSPFKITEIRGRRRPDQGPRHHAREQASARPGGHASASQGRRLDALPAHLDRPEGRGRNRIPGQGTYRALMRRPGSDLAIVPDV